MAGEGRRSRDSAGRTALAVGGLVWIVLIGAFVAGHAEGTAAAFGLEPIPWVNRFFDLGLLVAVCASTLACARLVLFASRAGKRWSRVKEAGAGPLGTSGVIMAEFAMVFPLFALMLSMTFQMMLLVNASIVVRYSAFSAARTAIVHMERTSPADINAKLVDPSNRVERSAELVLATISPRANAQSSDAAGRGLYQIVQAQAGPWGDRGYRHRLTYAAAATTVNVDPKSPEVAFGIPNPLAPRQVDVTVNYDFLITLPGINWLPGATRVAPGIAGGRAFRITKICRLQATGARAGHPVMMVDTTGNFFMP